MCRIATSSWRLTADEEGGTSNGVDWLLKNHRELIDAEFVINLDGGGIFSEHGKPQYMAVDASEKLYSDYQLTVTNPGGHSSLPTPDNAIYQLADAPSQAGALPVSFRTDQRDPRLLRAHGQDRYGRTRGRHACDPQNPSRPERRGAPFERSHRQFDRCTPPAWPHA